MAAAAIQYSINTPQSSGHTFYLCTQGAVLLADWLRAEPRLYSILPEMMTMPAHILTAASNAGDLYLAHLRDCTRCCTPAHA